jgi:hypothetical protein
VSHNQRVQWTGTEGAVSWFGSRWAAVQATERISVVVQTNEPGFRTVPDRMIRRSAASFQREQDSLLVVRSVKPLKGFTALPSIPTLTVSYVRTAQKLTVLYVRTSQTPLLAPPPVPLVQLA